MEVETTLNRSVCVLVGPTASGKTEAAIQLAKKLDGEIISADSRQIYKYLDIGTAKPTRDQRTSVVHHFIDILNPDQTYSAGEFGERGRSTISEILQRGKTPIVVGGSGLYVRALVDGLFDGPPADPEYRETLDARLRNEGIQSLMNDLRIADPELAARIDITKPRRVIRALEVHHITGISLSQQHREQRPEIPFVPFFFGLEWERGELYRRIEKRCDEMIEQGLVQETDSLLKRGYSATTNALNTVGYCEAMAYLRGEISAEEMTRIFKQNSRRYSKRQRTWFRRDGRIDWIKVTGQDSMEAVTDVLAQKFKEKILAAG